MLFSSIFAWRILRTEELGGLLSTVSHRVRYNWSDLACMHALEKEMTTHSSVLAWKIPGTEKPGGLPSMGSHTVGHDWSDILAAAATCTYISSLPFHGLIAHFFLVLNNIPLFGFTTVYLFSYWKISWLLSSFSSYKRSCYKHPCLSFFIFPVDVSVQLFWVNTRESDCLITW